MQQERIQLVCKDGQVHFLPGPQNQILLQCNSMQGDVPKMIADSFSVHKPGKTTVISADFDRAEVRLNTTYQQSSGIPDTDRSARLQSAQSRKSWNSDIEAVMSVKNSVKSNEREPRDSSPDRLLNLKFQEVSPENPFSVAPEVQYRAKSAERRIYDKSDPMAEFKADFDKIHNISPEQRKSMVVPDVIDNRVPSPDNRRKYSESRTLHGRLFGEPRQNQGHQAPKSKSILQQSPYKGLTGFQTQLMARDPNHVNFQEEAREALRDSGFKREIGLHMMEPSQPLRNKTHSSPKRRGQAPVQGRSTYQPQYNQVTDLDKNRFRNTSSTLNDILSPQLNRGKYQYNERRTPTKPQNNNNQQANVWNRLTQSNSPDKKTLKRSPYTWRYVNNEGEDLRAGKTSDFFENAHIQYRQFEPTIRTDVPQPERHTNDNTAKFGDGGSRVQWPSKHQEEPEMFDFHEDMRNAPKMTPIDQAIDQTFDSEPVPAVKERRVKPKSPVRFGLQEPVYGRVSQSLLKDFKQKPLHVLDDDLDLTSKEAEFKRRPQYHDGFLMGSNEVEPQLDPQDLKAVRKLHRLANGLLANDRHAGISELTWCMKMVHDSIRDRRQELLNSYIAYQAVKIQKNWRGYYARKYLIPFRQRLGVDGYNKLIGVVLGWKTRAIMRVPEIIKRAQSIIDHDIEMRQQQSGLDLKELKHSRKNTVQKFRHLIDTLHRGGQWTMLKWTNLILDESKYTIPKTKEEEQQLLDQIMNNQKALHQMALRRPKQGVPPYMKINMNSSPTNSTSFIEQHSNGFDYDINSNQYKQQAREILERRKNYRPGQRSPESHQNIQHQNFDNPYRLSQGPRSPPARAYNLSGTNLRNSYIEPRDRWDMNHGRMKLKDENVEGRKSFVRRMTYEPDLRKRNNNDFNGSVFTHGTADNDYLSTIKERRSLQRSNTKAVLKEDKEGGRMMLPPALKGRDKHANPYMNYYQQSPLSDLTDINVQAEENIKNNNQTEQPRKPRGLANTPGATKEDISYLPNKVRIEGLYQGQKTVENKDPHIYRSLAEQMKQQAQKELDRQKQNEKVRDDLRKKYNQANSNTEFGEDEGNIDERDPSVDPFYDQRKQQDQMMEEMLGGRSNSVPNIKGKKPGKYHEDEVTEKNFQGQPSFKENPNITQQVAEFDIFDPKKVEEKRNFAAAQKQEEENYNEYVRKLTSEKSETERKIQEEEAKILEDHEKEIKRLDDIRKKAEEVAKYLQEKSQKDAARAEDEKQKMMKEQQEFKDQIEREKAAEQQKLHLERQKTLELEKQRKEEEKKLQEQRQKALENEKLLEEQKKLLGNKKGYLTDQKGSAIPEFEEFDISDAKSSTFKIDPKKIGGGSPDGYSPLANDTKEIESPDSTGTFGLGLQQIRDGERTNSPISQSKLPNSPYNDDGDSQFVGFQMTEVDNNPKAEKFPGLNEDDALRVPSQDIKLTKDQLNNLRGAFDSEIRSRDGKLNKNQLRNLLANLDHYIPNDKLKKLLEQAKTDHNDQVDFDEFCQSVDPDQKAKKQNAMLDKLKEAFLNFSKTGTILIPKNQLEELKENFEKSDPYNEGKLTTQELANHLENLDHIPETNLNKIMNLAKPDRHGQINFKDLIDKVLHHHSQPHDLDDQLIQLPQEQVNELRNCLNKADPYHGGKVQKDLLKELLKKVLHKDVPHHILDTILDQAQPNHKGDIDFEDFSDAITIKKAARPDHELLDVEQFKNLKDMFAKVDPNNHRKITSDNLKALLEKLQVPKQKIDKLLDLTKPNRLGQINFDDFCNDVKSKECIDKEGQIPHMKLEDIQKQLAKADSNKDSKISKNELKDALLKNLGKILKDNIIDQLVDKAQPDRNGEINYDQFLKDLDDHNLHPKSTGQLLPENQLEKLKQALNKADFRKDGKLSKDQLQDAILKSLAKDLTQDKLKQLLEKAKPDQNGQHDIKDFVNQLGPQTALSFSAPGQRIGNAGRGGTNKGEVLSKDKQKDLHKILKNLDHDKDGKISKDHLEDALEKNLGYDLTKDQLQDLLDKAKPGHDGLVDLQKYQQELKKPQDLKDHPDFIVEQFAPKFRIARKGKNVGKWRPATQKEFNEINYILQATELKNNTPVAFDGGRFHKNNKDELINDNKVDGNEEFVLYIQDESIPLIDDEKEQHEIETEDLGDVLKSIGYNPTKSQLNGIVNQLDPNGKGSISWPKFLSLMNNNKNLPKQSIGDLLDSIGKPKNYNNYSDLNTTDGKDPFGQKRRTQDMLSTAQTDDKYLNQYIQAWARKTTAGAEGRLNTSLNFSREDDKIRNNLGTFTEQKNSNTVDEFDISPFDAQMETINEKAKGSLIKNDRRINQSELLQDTRLEEDLEVTIKRKKKTTRKTKKYVAPAYTGLTTSASRKITVLTTAESRKEVTIGTEVQRLRQSRQTRTAKRNSVVNSIGSSVVSSEGLRDACVDCRCSNSLSKSRERMHIPINKGDLTGLYKNMKVNEFIANKYSKQSGLAVSAKSSVTLPGRNAIKVLKKKSPQKGRTSEVALINEPVLQSGRRRNDSYKNDYMNTKSTAQAEGGANDQSEDVYELKDEMNNKPRPAIEYESVLESLKNQVQGQQIRRIESETNSDMDTNGFKINLVKAATGKSSQYSNSYLNK